MPDCYCAAVDKSVHGAVIKVKHMERKGEEDVPCTELVKHLQSLLANTASQSLTSSLTRISAAQRSMSMADANELETLPEENSRRRRR